MKPFDFNAEATLYLGSDRHTARKLGARTFSTSAKALRFALEEAAPISLHGAVLIVRNRSFAGTEMLGLYRHPDYPYRRKADVEPGWLESEAA